MKKNRSILARLKQYNKNFTSMRTRSMSKKNSVVLSENFDS